MKRFAIIVLTVASAIQAPALAQTAATAPAGASSVPAITNPSPAALAAARLLAARLLPPGVYKQIMSSMMDMTMVNLRDTLKAMPLREIAVMAGATAEDAQEFAKVDVAAVMAIYDPRWEERQQRTMRAMFGAMGDFFSTMEPDLREATAHAYAGRFSVEELHDLDRYFGTPTGAKFASGYMTLMSDPAILAAMKDMMPKMMQQMPHIMETAQKATADLPPPRKIEELTPDERARLAKALGVDEAKLRDPKDGI